MVKKVSDYTLADVERYGELIDEFRKTMPFGQAIKLAQDTIKKSLIFRRKKNKQ